jgi:hypothetical protein
MSNLTKKYKNNDPKIEDAFVTNGFVIIKDIFEEKTINDLYNFFLSYYKKLRKLNKEKKIPLDFELWSFAIIGLLEKDPIYNKYINSPNLLNLLKIFLGPDICTLGYNSIWINNPSNKNPVINKSAHVDAWTGTSTNTLFFKVFLTDVDKYNGLTVYPKSHLQGMIPVKSRAINTEDYNIKFDPLNLSNIKKGDAVMWHALLLHATTGQSDKNQRVSMTARFTSTENDFSSQERALGYETLKVGPLNKIKRLIGNDFLYPLRTYGTFAKTDKRLSALYDNTEDSLEKIINLLNN